MSDESFIAPCGDWLDLVVATADGPIVVDVEVTCPDEDCLGGFIKIDEGDGTWEEDDCDSGLHGEVRLVIHHREGYLAFRLRQLAESSRCVGDERLNLRLAADLLEGKRPTGRTAVIGWVLLSDLDEWTRDDVSRCRDCRKYGNGLDLCQWHASNLRSAEKVRRLLDGKR